MSVNGSVPTITARDHHVRDPDWAKKAMNSPCYGTWRGQDKKAIIMQLVFVALVMIALLSAYIGCYCV